MVTAKISNISLFDTGYIDTTFLAALSSDVSVTGTLIFDRDDMNPGSHYNPATGEYTIPYYGVYQFSLQLQASGSIEPVFFDVYLDGRFNDVYTTEVYRTTTFVLELSVGQVVTVRTNSDLNGHSDELMSYFAHLIFPC